MKLLLCLCALILSTSVLAQELSLRNLLKLRKLELAQINRKLSGKGWQFVSDSKPTDATMGKAIWAYHPMGESSTAWCIIYYNHTSPSRILYNISGGKAIQKIQKKIEKRKMSVWEEGQQQDAGQFLGTFSDYADDKHVMRLLKYVQPNYYGIKIFMREDYLKAKENGRL
ncbi:hypothetical protein [Botryobacter ruber]|uniref:hypothetical protein n=1 Tax=Botryobacter ruber TaxID=2171629 RepID=UPI000F655FB8|nr:hypothetical protein [Botryobacter ruber]